MLKLTDLAFGELFVLKLVSSYLLLKFLPLPLAIGWICAMFGTYFWYLHRKRCYWAERGVAGPPQHILFGNTKDITKGFIPFDRDNTKKYGPIFGTQLLGRPHLIVSDLDAIRQVVIKDFSHFVNRRANRGLVENKYNVLSHALTALRDDRWKNVRGTVTPAFTTGKMKKMFPVMQNCVQILSKKLQKHAQDGTSFDAKILFGGLTMDVIAKSAFGIDVDAQNDTDSPFVRMAQKITNFKLTDPIVIFGVAFPNLARHWQNFTKRQLYNNDVNEFFRDAVRNVIAERERHPKAANADFLQILLDTLKNAESDDADEKDTDISHDAIHKSAKKVQLEELEIVAQSFLFLVAGYETTATTLQFIAYEMAMNPEIQELCHRQIIDALGKKESIEYEDLMKMPLLEQVMMETLRMYPPASRFERECKIPSNIGGIQLQMGDCVAIAVSVVHNNPDIYPEPEKFDPDRFSPEVKSRRDPLTFLAFGAGPRNCIGMRFAQLEIRLALAYLLKQFKLVANEKTPERPLRLMTAGLTKAMDPIIVSVVER